MPTTLEYRMSHLRALPISSVLLAGLLLVAPVRATIVLTPVEIVPMPVQELASLLEARWQLKGDVEALTQAALVHALAYALKTDVARVRKESPESGWFNYLMDPFAESVEATGSAQQQAAEAHLQPARALYSSALAMMPDSSALRFEYARLLDISGDRQQAIANYRLLIESEAFRNAGSGGATRPYAVLAARRLVTLLDPLTDGEEILHLRELTAPDPQG
jgi:hypothetical protein